MAMTTTLSARRLGLVLIPLFLGLFLVGCATTGTPAVDWNSRVGNYTFDQAKAELGAPTLVTKTPEAGPVCNWLTRANPGTPGMDTVPRAGGVDQPTSQALSSLPKSEYLILTFDAGGKLLQ